MRCVQVTICLEMSLQFIYFILILILSVICIGRFDRNNRSVVASEPSETESNRDDDTCSIENHTIADSEDENQMTEANIFELYKEFYEGMGNDELQNLDNYLDRE